MTTLQTRETAPPPAEGAGPAFAQADIAARALRFRETTHILRDERGRLGVATEAEAAASPRLARVAMLAPLYPEWLGDRGFLEAHRVRFPYMAGSMANGIATARFVIALAQAGMLASFGAAGLAPERIEAALVEIEAALPRGASFAANLIHSPAEPDLEERAVDLYLRRGVRILEASAYMGLTPAIVRYACTGLATDPQGRLTRRNAVVAKISRPEVARHFLSPAPAELVRTLVAAGKLTAAEGALAARVPLAEDITVEADSAGHTDNRPLGALLPAITALRDELCRRHGYARPIRVGAAGGLGTPLSLSAAFAMGAAYVVTGSVNQAAVESGLSAEGRRMLALADMADVQMAPAADMFELGVRVQVLKRGTLFAARAARLYEIYEKHESIEAIPPEVRAKLEAETIHASLDEVWADTRRFWEGRDPREVERALREPRHRLALCCRWYLGKASRWAITGESARRLDFQIWCGPAMGAFNAWVAGSFLEEPESRTAVQIARNLLEGAAAVTRAHQLRSSGVPVPQTAFHFRPRPLQ